MTIAISIKVNDGVVLAADSATTLLALDPQHGAPVVVNVYNSANKVFNLRKGLPIGVITWGAGNIGAASISTLLKDLRQRLSSAQETHHDWVIEENQYSVLTIADKVRQFFFDEKYTPAFAQVPEEIRPVLGFIVAGYSSGSNFAEEYLIQIQNGKCAPPLALRSAEQTGLTWNGEIEAITRLIVGFSPSLPMWFKQVTQMADEQLQVFVADMQQVMQAALVQPAMPIQDAIDLADFLVQTAIQYSRFAPGAQTVGGPIEIAAITKHEGFKWIKRKLYYQNELNPVDNNHAQGK